MMNVLSVRPAIRSPMPPAWPTILVFLHVLGAAAWVGGQLALGVMTRALRDDRERLRLLARRAQPLLWSGFLVAAASGVALWHGTPALLAAKVVAALAAAAGAILHTWNARRAGPAWLTGAGAAIALLASLVLVALGAALRWS